MYNACKPDTYWFNRPPNNVDRYTVTIVSTPNSNLEVPLSFLVWVTGYNDCALPILC